MRPILLLAVAATALALQQPERAAVDRALQPDTVFRELFFGVLEGLYDDGVPNAVVDALFEPGPSLFVPGCPLCTPVRNAFRVYRQRPEFQGYKLATGTFGEGFPEATRRRLTHADFSVRHAALQELVRTWVSRRLDRMRLTPEERTTWNAALESRRKEGARLMGGAAERFAAPTCASCDGATGACPPR